MIAMRHVEAHDIHACHRHLFEHGVARGGRSDGTDNLSFSHDTPTWQALKRASLQDLIRVLSAFTEAMTQFDEALMKASVLTR
jgi:hypothetical protein